jgi:hypothetical protein
MRFPMPNYPCEFDIPDEWWAEAGMNSFTPTTSAYRSAPEAVLVQLGVIEPPYRFLSTPKDWHGFDRGRLVSVLNAIATGSQIEPVPLLKLPLSDFPPAPYGYRVRDGFHRFYASIAAGFERLPTASA